MNSVKSLLLTVFAVALGAASASAADLPLKAKAASAAVVNWGGLYVGAAGGYSWGNADRTDLDYFNGYGDFTQKTNGGIIGGTVGYNWQKSHFVYGVEGDLSYLSNRSSTTTYITPNNSSSPDLNSNKIDGLATLRGRVGLAIDDALFYTTAGLAIGDVHHSYAEPNERGGAYFAGMDGWKAGWVAGAGVEQKLSPSWSWKAEALYYQLGDKTINAFDPSRLERQKFSDNGFIARVGVNYALTSAPMSAQASMNYSTKAPMMATAAANWTGFYVGAAGGYSWANADRTDLDYFNGYNDFTQKTDGAIIGGTLGYNSQKGHMVYGVEGDLSYLTNKTGLYATCTSCSPIDINSNKIDGLATVRGRVGVAIDDTLYYTTAGLAVGDVSHTYANPSDLYFTSMHAWKAGWVVGAGVEQKWSPAWSWKAEALFYQLGDTTVSAIDFGGNGSPVDRQKFSDQGFITRIGVNYALASGPMSAQASMNYPTKAAPALIAANWSGGYIGVAGGYSWGNADRVDLDYYNGYGDFTQKTNGAIIGGTAGYNWQKSHVVYGVEGDLSYLSNRSATLTFASGNSNGPDVNSNKIDGLATVRGRVGVAIDDALFYTTAGLAVGDVQHSYAEPNYDSYNPRMHAWKAGWTAGAGFEQKWSPAWSWKAEALFYQLADTTVSAISPGGNSVNRQKFSDDGLIARVGVNYALGR